MKKKLIAIFVTMVLLIGMLPMMSVSASSGNAWVGGTFMHYYEFVEWYSYEDYSVPFTVGQPFTAVLDFNVAEVYAGEEGGTLNSRRHVAADWGYALVVQTDHMGDTDEFDAFIESIVIDGRNVSFVSENVGLAFDAGIRVPVTIFPPWFGGNEAPVENWMDIGEFTRMEVTLAIVTAGTPNPFGAATPEPAETEDEPTAAEEPTAADEPTADEPTEGDPAEDEPTEDEPTEDESADDIELAEPPTEIIEIVPITEEIEVPAPATEVPQADPPAAIATDSDSGMAPGLIAAIVVAALVAVGAIVFFVTKKKD
ncbi:MAG: hypothetical protein FWF81_06055 [Defluviitaleaceae bacterium]|nr:hypothetical protein [Defluviitaleaceae bacterium]